MSTMQGEIKQKKIIIEWIKIILNFIEKILWSFN